MKDVAAVAGVDEEKVKKVADIFRHPKYGFIYPALKDSRTDDPLPLFSETKLDVCHESFLRQWKKAQEWIGEEQKKAKYFSELSTQAKRWTEDRRAKLQGVSLEWALQWWKDKTPTEEWAERYGDGFQIVKSFLEASQRAAADSQKAAEERERRSKWTKIAIVVVPAILIIAGVWISMIIKAKAEIEKTAKELRATEISLLASYVRATNQPLSTLLALDALAMAKQSTNDLHVWLARAVLSEVVKGCPPSIFFGETNKVRNIAFARRTPTLYAFFAGASVQKIDPINEAPKDLQVLAGNPELTALSGDENCAAGYYHYRSNDLRLINVWWSLPDTNLSEIQLTNEPCAIALAPKGEKLFALGSDGTLASWTSKGLREFAQLPERRIDYALFSSSTERLLTVAGTNLNIYSITNISGHYYKLNKHHVEVADVNRRGYTPQIPAAFCPGNENYLFLSYLDSFCKINCANGNKIKYTDTGISNGIVRYLAVNDNGTRIAAVYDKGLLRVFDLNTNAIEAQGESAARKRASLPTIPINGRTIELTSNLGEVQGLDISSDGRYVAALGINGGIMWDLNVLQEMEGAGLDSFSHAVLLCARDYTNSEIPPNVTIERHSTSQLSRARMEAILGHYKNALDLFKSAAPLYLDQDYQTAASNWLGYVICEKASRSLSYESALHLLNPDLQDSKHRESTRIILSEARDNVPANLLPEVASLQARFREIEFGTNQVGAHVEAVANPSRVQALIEIGNNAADAGNLESAISSYKEAINLDPSLSSQLNPTNEAFRRLNITKLTFWR